MSDSSFSGCGSAPGPSCILRSSGFELLFDATSGRWESLTDRRDARAILHSGHLLSPLLLTVGGRTIVSRGYNQLFSVADAETVGLRWQLAAVEPSGDRVVVRLREGDWHAELTYCVRGDRFERRVRIAYEGEGEALLRYFTLRMPFADLGAPSQCFVEQPGYPMRTGRRVSYMGFGAAGQPLGGAFCDSLAWRPPLTGIHNPDDQRCVMIWAHTETEPFYSIVERAEEGVFVSHRVYLASRLSRGQSLDWGTEYLRLTHCNWMEALAGFQDFYDEVGLSVPSDVPQWAKSINMYEVHVGTLSGTSLAPFPTYTELIEELPRIRAKGYDAVYIMPHVPYPSYAVVDYMDLDVQQGGAAGFKEFIRKAHEAGLKALMDVTIHGVMDRRSLRRRAELEGSGSVREPFHETLPEVHPYLTEHPEWFSRNESGEVAMTYTYAFDHASPSWQDFMAGVFRHYVEEYDVDGFRVDSHTWSFFPNWAKDLSYPASRSFYGSAQLFKRIRREVKALKPDVVFYTETAGPLLHSSHELGYNYDETWMLLSAWPILSRRGMLCHFAATDHVTGHRLTAHEIANWLAQRQLALPRGAIKVHHLDSHDSYWRPREFRRETFGAPAATAIAALFAFIEGGFMDYHGADAGLEEIYARLVRLRRDNPAMRHGTCDYLAVAPGDPHVFACLREWSPASSARAEAAPQTLLAAINLVDLPICTTLPIPASRLPNATVYRVTDLYAERIVPGPLGGGWRAAELGELSMPFAPYGIALLAFDGVDSAADHSGSSADRVQ